MQLRKRDSYPIAFFALVTIALISVATTFLLWDMRSQQLERTRLGTIALTRIYAEQIERNFASADLVLEGVQERMQTSFGSQIALDGEQVRLLLGTRVKWMQQLDALYIADADGWIVNWSLPGPVPRVSIADGNYFPAMRSRDDPGLYVGRPARNVIEKDWVLQLARRINDADGNFRGAVIAEISTDHFEDGFNLMRLDYMRPVALYRSDGTLIASVPQRAGMVGDRPPELGADPLLKPGQDMRFLSHVKGVGSREELTLQAVPKFPLLVSVTNVEDEALAVWRETSIPIIGGVVMVCAMIIFVAALFIRKVRREQRLTHALGEVSDRYQQTVDSVMDAIVGVDEGQRIILFNPAAEKMFGRTTEEVLGRPLVMLIPERYRAAHHARVGEFRKSAIASRAMAPLVAITGLHANGTEFPIESTISQTVVNGRSQQTAVLRDVTETRRAERELVEMNAQLRGLSIAQEKIREQERGRIAGELHDDLGQQLTGLKLDISWLSNRIKDGRLPERDKVDALRQHIDVAIASVRRISTELRPLILNDLGFGEAVAWQAGEFSKRTGITVSLDLAAQDQVISDDLSIALFRITQESLTNVARHSRAAHATIDLSLEDDVLVLTIQDNGQGVDHDQGSGGFGLLGIRERAKAVGGTFTLRNRPEGGAEVRIEIPLDSSIFNKADHEA